MGTISRKELIHIIEKAKLAGLQAANEKYLELKQKAIPGKLIDECGVASIILRVDGRSKLGKFLSSLEENPINNLDVTKSTYFRGYIFSILGISPFQERSVCVAAQETALQIIKENLGVEGYVTSIVS